MVATGHGSAKTSAAAGLPAEFFIRFSQAKAWLRWTKAAWLFAASH